MANVNVARSVNQAVSEDILVRDIGDRIVHLQPDVTPLLVMTTNAKRKAPTRAVRIEKIEDDLRELWAFHNASAIDSVATAVLVNDGSLFAVGDLVAAMLADTALTAEEVMRVTAVATNTLTVTRDVGGTGANDTLAASSALRIIGSAYEENATLSRVRSTNKTTIISYAQIFKTPTEISNTKRAQEIFGEPDEDYQLSESLKEHKKEIEGSGLWGRASESLASPGSIWTTMGLKARIATNVTDAGATLTLREFNDFSETAFRFGSAAKLFIAAPRVISAVNWFAQGALRVENATEVFGVNVRRLILPHGELMLARNWLMEDGTAGQPGYDDEAYAVDVDSTEYRFLAGNGISRDTKLFRDVISEGRDGRTHYYLTQAGFVFMQEKRFARIANASDYA